MSKSTQPMSLSVSPQLIKEIDIAAKKRNATRSQLACDLFEDFKDLDIETHLSLRQVAKQRGVSVSALIEFLLGKFPLNDVSVKPIVLRIPVEVAEERDELITWLGEKCKALINHLHPK